MKENFFRSMKTGRSAIKEINNSPVLKLPTILPTKYN